MLADGLHESIDHLQRKVDQEVGRNIFETYVLLPFEIKERWSCTNGSTTNATAIDKWRLMCLYIT